MLRAPPGALHLSCVLWPARPLAISFSCQPPSFPPRLTTPAVLFLKHTSLSAATGHLHLLCSSSETFFFYIFLRLPP